MATSTRDELVGLVRSPAFLSVMAVTWLLPVSAAISPALPSMATALGVSDARVGLVITAITLPPMILAPVVGVLGDMYGRRAIAIPGLLLYGGAGVGIAFVDTFVAVLGLRALQGVAMAGIGPLTVTLLGDLYDGTEATTAQGLRMSAAGISLLVIPLAAGALAGIGWQYPFLLYGLSLFVAVAVWIYVPETAPDREQAPSIRGSLRNYARSIRDEVDPRLLILMSGGFVRFFSWFGFMTFVPIFAVRVLGASPFLAGLAVAAASVRIPLSPTAGWWVVRFSRRWALVGTLAIQVVVFAAIPFAPSVWALAALAVLYGVGDAIFGPMVNDGVTAVVAAENRNGVVGGLRVMKEAGKTAGPAALGAILAVSGYFMLFLSLTVLLGVYIVMVAVGLRTAVQEISEA
ncbi:MAG: MFS transporter [Salinirussus sp.]